MNIINRSTLSSENHTYQEKSQGGFTIIEALISIILFTIVLAGGMAIYVNANRIVTLASHKKMAVEIANLRMEELRTMSYTAFGTNFTLAPPYIVEPFPDGTPTVGDLPATRTVTVAHVPPGPTPDYKSAIVNVTWSEADNASPRVIELTSVIVP